MLGYWMLLQLSGVLGPAAVGGGVAYGAHLGGFVAGLLLVPFFRNLQEEIDDLRERGVEEFHFTDIRKSALILRGKRSARWTPRCDRLHQEILAFLQNFAQQPVPASRQIHLTIEL